MSVLKNLWTRYIVLRRITTRIKAVFGYPDVSICLEKNEEGLVALLRYSETREAGGSAEPGCSWHAYRQSGETLYEEYSHDGDINYHDLGRVTMREYFSCGSYPEGVVLGALEENGLTPDVFVVEVAY